MCGFRLLRGKAPCLPLSAPLGCEAESERCFQPWRGSAVPFPSGVPYGTRPSSQVWALAPARPFPRAPLEPGGGPSGPGRWWAVRRGCPGRPADCQDRWWAGQGSGARPICSRPPAGLFSSTWSGTGMRPSGGFCPGPLTSSWVICPRGSGLGVLPGAHPPGRGHVAVLTELQGFPRVPRVPAGACGSPWGQSRPWQTGNTERLPEATKESRVCAQLSSSASPAQRRGGWWEGGPAGGGAALVGGQDCSSEEGVVGPMQAPG